MKIDQIKISKSAASDQMLLTEQIFDWLIKENSQDLVLDPMILQNIIESKEWKEKDAISRYRDDHGDDRPVTLDLVAKEKIRLASVRELMIESIVWEIAHKYDLFCTPQELEKEYELLAKEQGLKVKQVRSYYQRENGFREERLKFFHLQKECHQFSSQN